MSGLTTSFARRVDGMKGIDDGYTFEQVFAGSTSLIRHYAASQRHTRVKPSTEHGRLLYLRVHIPQVINEVKVQAEADDIRTNNTHLD